MKKCRDGRWRGFALGVPLLGSSARLSRAGVLALFFALVLSACGKGRANEPKNPEGADASAESPAVSPEELLPLEPVEAPADVVLRLRVKNPDALVDGIMEAAALPFDWRKLFLLDNGATSLVSALDQKGAIEAAVVMNLRNPAKPYSFFSIGALGVREVLNLLDQRRIEFQESPGGVHLFQWEREPCAVGRAISGSPARIVCAPDEDSLRHLLPYALRGLPGHTLPDADAYLELDLRPVRAQYGKELSRARLLASVFARQAHVGHAKYDTAVSDAVNGALEELAALLQDTDLFTAKLYGDKGKLRLQLATQFSGTTSTTVQSALLLQKAQDQAPALFDALPATASAAGYSRQLSAAAAAPWMNILVDLATGRAEYEGASVEFSRRLARVLRAFGPQGGSSVAARGPLIQTVTKGKASLGSSWVVLGTEQKKADIEGALDDLAWILASKDLKELLPKVEHLPKFRRVKKTLPGVGSAAVFEWDVPKEATAQLREDFRKNLPEGGNEFSTDDAMEMISHGTLAVHEAAGFTWLSWGNDPAGVAESFRTLTAKDTQRLGDVGSLGGVRSERAVAAGFAKLDGLAATFAWLAPPEVSRQWAGLLRATPHRGQVPMLYFYRIKGGEQLEASWEVTVPAELTQDAATLALMLAAEFKLDGKQ